VNDEWPTPPEVFDLLAAQFGPFDLDPAATPENAKAPMFYTTADDGLSQRWKGRVWCNPPYSRGQPPRWLAKAIAETASGNAELVVCLVRAATGSRWWRQAMAAKPLERHWPERIKFVGAKSRAPFDSAVLVFGQLTGRHGTEPAWCAAPGCGRVFWPARSDAKTCSDACRQALSRSQITGIKRNKRRPLSVTFGSEFRELASGAIAPGLPEWKC
jgi:phage N-6-adenine-methyltransferase